MKPRLLCFLLSPLALPAAAIASVGASTASLVVDGSITPGGACDMSVGNGAIDLGTLSVADLNPITSEPTFLASHKLPMRIDCVSASRYAVTASGDGQGVGNEYFFGLSSPNDGTLVGSLLMYFDGSSAHIEGKGAYYTVTESLAELANAQWAAAIPDRTYIGNGARAIGSTITEGSTAGPSKAQRFDTYLVVQPKIRAVDSLDLTDEIAVVGSVTFEIRYF
jgi:hypothetical protein